MLLLTGHQKALLVISAAVLVLQIGLDVVLIPRYGIVGAAVADVDRGGRDQFLGAYRHKEYARLVAL